MSLPRAVRLACALLSAVGCAGTGGGESVSSPDAGAGNGERSGDPVEPGDPGGTPAQSLPGQPSNGPGGAPGEANGGAGAGAPSPTPEPGQTPNDPTVPGTVPAEPLLPPSAQEFTRLTRVEYQRTVEQALGVTPPASAIPVDGRIGVFTSNASVTPDPVHPYLLLAEDLAAEVVPDRFGACEGDVAACVRDQYEEPISRLLRRDPTAAELDGYASLVADAVAAGAEPVAATRTLLAAVLVSPDFLFRTGPSNAEGASGRRLAERLSFALWDAPPDAELANLGTLSEAELPAALSTQVARVVGDARAVGAVARFLGQWLDVDTDRFREDDPEFEDSPSYVELLALVQDALGSDVAVTELVRSGRGFVHVDNADAYGLTEAPDGELAVIDWPEDSPRRGLLGQELFASSTRHPDPGRRVIFRGLLVRRALLCEEIPAPNAELVALAGEVGDRTEDTRCSGCHQFLDPIGVAFGPLDPDDDGSAPEAELVGSTELAGSYEDLPALLDAIAGSRQFAECFAQHLLEFLLEREPPELDPAGVTRLADAVQAGASLGALIEQVFVDLRLQSALETPWCEGE